MNIRLTTTTYTTMHNVYYVNMDTMHVYVHYVQYGGVVEVLETASQYMSTLSTLHGSSLCWNS